jgi:hypothetical protein
VKSAPIKRTVKTNGGGKKDAPYALPKTYNIVYDSKSFKGNKAEIWHWNVNGINAILSKGLLQKFIDIADPDILCLNETKIDSDRLKQLGI